MRTAALATMLPLGAICTLVLGDPGAQTLATQPASNTITLNLGDKVTLKLALIPAGKFTMGSPVTEQRALKDGFKDETQHEATLSTPFHLGVYLVTQEQYQQVTARTPASSMPR